MQFIVYTHILLVSRIHHSLSLKIFFIVFMAFQIDFLLFFLFFLAIYNSIIDDAWSMHESPQRRPARLVGKINFPMLHHTHIFLFFHTHTHFRRQQFDNDSLQRKWEHKSVKTTKRNLFRFVCNHKLQKQARSDHDHIIIFVQMFQVASSLTFRKRKNINK